MMVRGGKAERMAHAPFLLRIVYRIVPKRVADTLLPPESSLSRQVATLFASSFLVGAGMEAFMIKTGFYAVATRKEAERRAMAQWERDEMDRVKDERKRQKIEREKQDRQHYRQRLEEELRGLRAKERETGVALHGEKALVKKQLKEIVAR